MSRARVYVTEATLDVKAPDMLDQHPLLHEHGPEAVLRLELRGDYATLAAMFHHIRDMYEGRAPIPTASPDPLALPASHALPEGEEE